MTEQNDINEAWEVQINALLDGELSEEEARLLKREAEHNAQLAQAIIDAHALQERLDELEIERAPDSLRTRLAEIPQTERPLHKPRKPRGWFGLPRWIPAGALAAVPILVVAMVMMQSKPQTTSNQPEFTEAEILQASQEVALAFAYLDRVGQRAGQHIESELSEELSSGITENVSRYMPYTNQPEQEESS